MIKKKTFFIILAFILILIISILIFKILTKNKINGNNMNSQEIVDKILNLNSYKSKIKTNILFYKSTTQKMEIFKK